MSSNKEDIYEENDLDCGLCFELLYDPITLECGHTFCRNCIHQSFQRKKNCPICRNFSNVDTETHPSNILLVKLLTKYHKITYENRSNSALKLKKEFKQFYSIFISNTPYFPFVISRLHMFETKYKILVDRALKKDSKFIISHQYDYLYNLNDINDNDIDINDICLGTLCEIRNCQSIHDGRSLITFIGLKRVKLSQIKLKENSFGLLHCTIDDYNDMGNVLNENENKSNTMDEAEDIRERVMDFIRLQKLKPYEFYSTHGMPPNNLKDLSLWIAGAIPQRMFYNRFRTNKMIKLQKDIFISQDMNDRIELCKQLINHCIDETNGWWKRYLFYLIINCGIHICYLQYCNDVALIDL